MDCELPLLVRIAYWLDWNLYTSSFDLFAYCLAGYVGFRHPWGLAIGFVSWVVIRLLINGTGIG